MSRKAPTDRIVSQVTPAADPTNWTQAAHKLFRVTGEVRVKSCFGVVSTALTGASTLELGVAGNTACLIAQISAAATNLNAVNDVWIGRGTATYARYSGEEDGGAVILSGTGETGDIDIDLKVGAANVTAGRITFYIVYTPISGDGNIAAAIWD